MRSLRVVLQVLVYAALAVAVGWFSASPAYRHRDPGAAQLRLSLSHAGAHREECRQRTPEELARLAPNMRARTACPRERVPVTVELLLDGTVVYARTQPPAGLWKDGPSAFYQRLAVAAGHHVLQARLRDSRRADGYDFEATRDVELAPRQNFVVGFRTEAGGFTFE